MLSMAREEEDSDSDCSEDIATREDVCEKEGVFDVDGVLFHYNQEEWNMMSSNVSRKAYHFNICDRAVHLWRKGCSYKDVLPYVTFDNHCKVPTRHQCWTNKIHGFLRSASPGGYSSLSLRRMGRKKSVGSSGRKERQLDAISR